MASEQEQDKFEPELGQAVFSNSPWEEVEMQSFVENGLRYLADAVAQGDWNKNPAANVAAEFGNDVFELRSYCWCDGTREGHEDACPPNFKCEDFEARYYKYLGRGSSQNKHISFEEWNEIMQRCLASLSNS